MTHRAISLGVIVGLFATVFFAAVFALLSDGFYGRVAPSFWSALQPATLAQSDDVYLCNALNGQGSDDQIAVFLLVLLTPLFITRCIYINELPDWGGLSMFVVLSTPFFVMMFGGPTTCGDILLTLYVGQNVALALCLVGWLATLMLYLVAICRHRSA